MNIPEHILNTLTDEQKKKIETAQSPEDLLALNRILTALRTHHYDDPSLYFLRAASFTFEGAPDVTWTLDGEAADGSGRVEIRNIHNAISLIY